VAVRVGASFTGVTVRLMVSVSREYEVVPPRLPTLLRSAVPPLLPEILSQALTVSAEAKVPFNLWAMYFAYLPCQLWHWGEGTFCSRHVTEVLQLARVPHVLHLNASQVTPSSLYCALVQHQGRTPESPLLMQLVPSRMHRGEQAEQMRQQLLASRVT
jgi:hypothetical protein